MKSKGFTMVEVLIALALLAGVGVLLLSVLVQHNNIYYQQNAKVTQGLSLNDSVSELNDLIKTAHHIELQYPTSGQAIYTSNQSTIILALPGINSQGAVLEGIYDYIVITPDPLNSKYLRKIIYPTSPSVRTSGNKVLVFPLSQNMFYYLDSANAPVSPPLASKISFWISLSEKAGNQTQTSSSSSQINLRNN